MAGTVRCGSGLFCLIREHINIIIRIEKHINKPSMTSVFGGVVIIAEFIIKDVGVGLVTDYNKCNSIQFYTILYIYIYIYICQMEYEVEEGLSRVHQI